MSSIRTITSPLEIESGKKNVSFDTIVFKQNGCIIVRGDCKITIAKVINEKDQSASTKCEFLMQPPKLSVADPGEDGKSYTEPIDVSIAIDKLQNTISLKVLGGTGGEGGCGIAGGNGGFGADGYLGGTGGDGGNGGNGGTGGNGGPPPKVRIAFNAVLPDEDDNNDVPKIVVLSAEDQVCNDFSSFGGKGGPGGELGKGGEGGKGGKNFSNGAYAPNGQNGNPGIPGDSGEDYVSPGRIIIESLQPLNTVNEL